MDSAIQVFIVLFLIGLNGFFVASEYALVRLRTTQLDDKIKAGDKNARLVRGILSELNAYMSATQIGVTLSSLALGWIGEPLMARILEPAFSLFAFSPRVIFSISFALGFIILTALHIVIGEQIPKSIAINFDLKVALRIARPLSIFYTVFRPLIWLLNLLVSGTLRVLGFPQVKAAAGHTREELRTAIQQSADRGEVEQRESDMIDSMFGFRETTAKEVMVHRSSVVAINLDDEPNEIMRQILREGFSRLPVYRNSIDEITGVLYVKNLLADAAKLERLSAPGQNGEAEFFAILLRAIRPALIVSETQHLSSLLLEFQRSRNHMAIVVSEHGGVEGIVTMEDLLEELVGDIEDESDVAEAQDVIEVGNILYVDATLSVSDFNERYSERFGLIEESAEYATLSGYVQKIAGKIPNIGETIKDDGLKFTITRKVRHSLQQIRVEKV
jgi:CBS domain containing-hemolysin-like protein